MITLFLQHCSVIIAVITFEQVETAMSTTGNMVVLSIHIFPVFNSHERRCLESVKRTLLFCLKFRAVELALFYFNRMVLLWNTVCKIAPPSSLYSLTTFKRFLCDTYLSLLTSTFDVDMTCTWSLFRDCPCL